MSKLINPLFSLEARKKFGGAMVYKNRKGSNIVTALSKPTGPPSAAQRAARVKYHSYTKEWKELYQARKDIQDLAADQAERISGFHQFMHENLQISRATQVLYLADCAGLWHINEGQGLTAYDATKEHQDGTIRGAIWIPDYVGPVLEMNPDDSCILVSATDALNLTDEFTIKIRVKMLDHLKTSFFYGKNGTATNTMQYGLSMNPAGKIDVYLDGVKWATSVDPPHDTWMDLALIVKAGSYKKLYLNKTLGEETTQGTIDPTDNPLYIGSRGGPLPQPYDCFSGIYDEFGIYSRILTDAEL